MRLTPAQALAMLTADPQCTPELEVAVERDMRAMYEGRQVRITAAEIVNVGGVPAARIRVRSAEEHEMTIHTDRAEGGDNTDVDAGEL